MGGDAPAGVGEGQIDALRLHPELQGHPLLPVPHEFKGVGQQVQQQPLDPAAVHSDDLAGLGAAELQADAQQFGGDRRLLHDGPADPHDVVVVHPLALGPLGLGGVGEVVGQAEDAVIALAQRRRVPVHALPLVPQVRGSQPGEGVMDVSQREAQLAGHLLEHLAERLVLMKKLF